MCVTKLARFWDLFIGASISDGVSSNPATLLNFYLSLVHPHVEYASQVWSPYTARDIAKLGNVQKFVLRMSSHNWSASYQDLLTLFDISSLERRR